MHGYGYGRDSTPFGLRGVSKLCNTLIVFRSKMLICFCRTTTSLSLTWTASTYVWDRGIHSEWKEHPTHLFWFSLTDRITESKGTAHSDVLVAVFHKCSVRGLKAGCEGPPFNKHGPHKVTRKQNKHCNNHTSLRRFSRKPAVAQPHNNAHVRRLRPQPTGCCFQAFRTH